MNVRTSESSSSSYQIQNIKSLINKYFENEEVYALLQKKVKAENLRLEDLDNERLLEILRETHVMDKLLIDLNRLEEQDRPHVKENSLGPGAKKKDRVEVSLEKVNYRALALRVTKGMAFFQFMTKEDPNKNFVIFASFLQQRYVSKPVPCNLDPNFDDLFVFELVKEDVNSSQPQNLDLLSLSKLDAPIDITLVIIDEAAKARDVYATKKIEWRFLLTYGSINLNLELEACDDENKKILGSKASGATGKNVIGILQIEMDLLPKGNVQLIPERILNEQLAKEKKFKEAETLRFYEYSSDWWNDYKQIHKAFDKRSVKIYAENEEG
jgi:centrosomal protein CEP76